MLLSKTDKNSCCFRVYVLYLAMLKPAGKLSVVFLDLSASFSSIDPPYSFLIFLLGPHGPLKIPWFPFLPTRNSCSIFFNDSLSCYRRNRSPSSQSPALFVYPFSWRSYPISWLKYHLNIIYIRFLDLYLYNPDFLLDTRFSCPAAHLTSLF